MSDGRKNNIGGARPGAGRKTKAEILGLAAMIDESWPIAEQKKVIKKLAKDCMDDDFHIRQEARKLLLAYKFGKPTERHEHSGPNQEPIQVDITGAISKIYGDTESSSNNQA
jgi:hypothetical protein